MKTKKTDIRFYVEELCCDCGGDLDKIEQKVKHGKFLNYGITDKTICIYRCKKCGKEYSDCNFDLFGKNEGRFLVFEYNGEEYKQPMSWNIRHED